MINRKFLFLFSFSLIFIIVVVLVISRFYLPQDKLSENEVEQIIANLYEGELQELIEEDGIYKAKWLTEHGIYHVYVDAYKGEIYDLQTDGGSDIDTGELFVDQENVLTINAVFEIVKQFVGDDIQIQAIELENVRNQAVYEVEIVQQSGNGHLTLDAMSGEVLSYTFSENRTDNQNDDKSNATFISVEEAKRIALTEVSGVVDDIDLEESNGRYVYEVEIEEGEIEAEVIIDAITGDVITIIWED
ncbi:PepSY domain-containing protein [Bacillus sp. JCM 19034]|uniref:PepSY domain-containing protein n=1 Tax=Bacillus sp. JCM 19034 TaxID=1481928 RepID=UPI0007819AC2|nr:PepSY domain-containing protein [Bacillus sp. JCM 19034]